MPKSNFRWGEFRTTYVLLGYLKPAQIQDLVDRWPEWPGPTLRYGTQYQPDGRMVLLQQDAEGNRTARFAKTRKQE